MPILPRKPKDDTAPAFVPSLKLREQPQHIEAQKRLNALHEARVKIGARIREIELIVGTHLSAEEHAANQVEAALKFAETGISQRPLNDINSLRDEHLVLRSQAEHLDRELEKQRQLIYAIERDLAGQCLAANRGVHDDIMRRYTAALRALDAIVAEEDAFLARMTKLGFDIALQDRALWPDIGTTRDPNSSISMRLRELRQFDNA